MKDTTTIMEKNLSRSSITFVFSNTNAQHFVIFNVFRPLCILEQDNFNLPDIEGISKMYFVCIFSLSARLHENSLCTDVPSSLREEGTSAHRLHENIAKIIMYIRT